MEREEESNASVTEREPESLKTLAQYLERALDKATTIVKMRHAPGICTVYLGDPSGPREELKQVGAIATSLEDEMLRLTASGSNRMNIGEQTYRFARSFTQIDEVAAIVFST
ncbi:hypothetical protein [Caballeronia sp. LZ001]|uniref:hypothetical protein n=1 Tax=Caballeronia sp. LZ001 TaxID=3038553 RepID=UPI0028664AA0|nr:hypothetical protein [Caballeronia sp. LZ001]MDR5803742.1 hypothetical protein [Caballeronia sp. LZ001]